MTAIIQNVFPINNDKNPWVLIIPTKYSINNNKTWAMLRIYHYRKKVGRNVVL